MMISEIRHVETSESHIDSTHTNWRSFSDFEVLLQLLSILSHCRNKTKKPFDNELFFRKRESNRWGVECLEFNNELTEKMKESSILEDTSDTEKNGFSRSTEAVPIVDS